MTIPNKLPILRMEDYHTHYLGQAKDGRLFWGYLTFVFTKPYSTIEQGDDWKKYRKEYALVHTFDQDGNYLVTKHRSALANETTSQKEEEQLEQMVDELGEVTFQDIEIKIFETKIDDIIFGLVIDEESEMINLQPGSMISFQEPWDGEYYT